MTISPADVQRVFVVGDSHGDKRFARSVTKLSYRHGCPVLVVVGDWGFCWSAADVDADLRFWDAELDRAVKGGGSRDLTLVVVDGNHDNHPLLNSFPLIANGAWAGFRRLSDRVVFAPRGHGWTWAGVNFLALGGAVSVDRDRRVEGVDWWPSEQVTYADVDAALATAERMGRIDVMLTHDAPANAVVPGIGVAAGASDPMFPESSAHRRQIQGVVDAVRPARLVHGHMHVRYSHDMPTSDGHRVSVDGLACNVEGDERAWLVLDLPAAR